MSDEEWEFIAPSLTVLPLDALQRKHNLREVCNAVRYLGHTGAPWRYLPLDFPPWPAVYQQARRWQEAGSCAAVVHDLRLLVRLVAGRAGPPPAVIRDSRTLQSTPESGARAGDDGHKRRKGAKVPAAVATLGHLLALVVTPANEQDRAQVATVAAAVPEATGETVSLADVDQGDTGQEPARAAEGHGIRLAVVKLSEARHGFVLLSRRWVVERAFAFTSRFRRLARDDERLPSVLAGLHFLAFACLMLHQFIHPVWSP